MGNCSGDLSKADSTPPSDFRGCCVEKLEKLGDTAMDCKNYDEVIKRYSDALTLDPTNQSDILLKRSKVRAVMGCWGEALIDADKVGLCFTSRQTNLSDQYYSGYRALPVIPYWVREEARCITGNGTPQRSIRGIQDDDFNARGISLSTYSRYVIVSILHNKHADLYQS